MVDKLNITNYDRCVRQLYHTLLEQLDYSLSVELFNSLGQQHELRTHLWRTDLNIQLNEQLDRQLYKQLDEQLDEQLDRQLDRQLEEQIKTQLEPQAIPNPTAK